MPTRTPRERTILRGLTPHTRAHVLQLLAETGPVLITSGRRSKAKNAEVGGVPTSWHLQGRAVDLVGDRETLIRASGLAWALRLGPRCTGPEEVLLEGLGTAKQHLHLAW